MRVKVGRFGFRLIKKENQHSHIVESTGIMKINDTYQSSTNDSITLKKQIKESKVIEVTTIWKFNIFLVNCI